MRSTRLLPRVITILVFLASTVGITYSYAALRLRERNSYLISEPFRLGSSKVHLLFDKQCLGEFNLTFSGEGESHAFKGTGKLAFKVANNSYLPEFNLEAYFNELGQLGASIASITLPDAKFTFGTVGIDPLEFKFRMTKAEEKKLSFKIPGPIELRKFSDSKFAIRYSFLSQLKGGLPKMDLGFTFENGEGKKCSVDEKNPPNVTALLLRVLQMTSKSNFKNPIPFIPGESSFEIF